MHVTTQVGQVLAAFSGAPGVGATTATLATRLALLLHVAATARKAPRRWTLTW